MHSVDLIKHATEKLSSKLWDQIKAQQPYPQLHQGLIPFQTKLPFSFPLSPLKSPVIRSRLKVDYSTPSHTHASPYPILDETFLNPQSHSQFISIRGSGNLPPTPLQTGSPMCSAAFGVISLAVDRSSEGSAVITGSLRWRQGRGPLKKGTEAKKREKRERAQGELRRWSGAGESDEGGDFCGAYAKPRELHAHTWLCLHAKAHSPTLVPAFYFFLLPSVLL